MESLSKSLFLSLSQCLTTCLRLLKACLRPPYGSFLLRMIKGKDREDTGAWLCSLFNKEIAPILLLKRKPMCMFKKTPVGVPHKFLGVHYKFLGIHHKFLQ